jgi:hypothetical protein
MNKVAIVVVSLILAVVAGLASYTCTAAAQSVSKEVTLEAYIIPAIDFTVDPGSIDFETDEPQAVTITNTGAWDLSVACRVTGSYADELKLDGKPWGLFNVTIKRDDCQEIDVALTVPKSCSGVGESGTIIFWAAEAH